VSDHDTERFDHIQNEDTERFDHIQNESGDEEHLITIRLIKRGDKILAYVRQADELEDEPMELPPAMAGQLPMAIAMMREQLG